MQDLCVLKLESEGRDGSILMYTQSAMPKGILIHQPKEYFSMGDIPRNVKIPLCICSTVSSRGGGSMQEEEKPPRMSHLVVKDKASSKPQTRSGRAVRHEIGTYRNLEYIGIMQRLPPV